MTDKYPPMSAFARAFAHEFRGFMKAAGVTGERLAEVLGRNAGYVSERVNGKRALDTNDVDALASLVPGWSGKALMLELARRTRAGMETPSTVIELGVGRRGDDLKSVELDGARIAASTDSTPVEPARGDK